MAIKRSEENIKWKVISDRRPNGNPKKSKFQLEHALGPTDPITTTMPPNTTTSRPLNGEVKVYIVAVNEQGFYHEKFPTFYDEIKGLAEEKGCNITRTHIKSCRLECGMTTNPDRGCLTFEVGLEDNPIFCNYQIEAFKNDMKKK